MTHSHRAPSAERAPSEVPKAVLSFMAAGLVVVILISVAGSILAVRASTREAIRGAKTLSEVNGEAVVEPALEEGIFTADPAAIARLDALVRLRVLGDRIVRVKVWAPDGHILYSDEPRLIGARYDLGEDEQAILAKGGSHIGVSDLSAPENRFERPRHKLLEVYRRLDAPGGQPVLFEAYLPYDQVSALARRLWLSLAPALIGGLVLLYVIQIPLAWRMAGRLQEGQRQRVRLTRMAAEASETERRRIAADLHDGVVQGLVGSSYTLAAAADRARDAGAPEVAATVAQAGTDLRRWVRDLRTLLVTIAPPTLHQEGLSAALSDLVSAAAARGIEATIDVEPGLQLEPATETLVFRAAQEAVRNATHHAHPSELRLSVHHAGGHVRLEVADDGAGFGPGRRQEAADEGHIGLTLLGALAEDAGGRLEVDSTPGRGTRICLEVPA
ncbi:MAG: histidine kinase [Actinomycetota bacterium]|nr:histidine kinase [Actinomycetota bacterium]